MRSIPEGSRAGVPRTDGGGANWGTTGTAAGGETGGGSVKGVVGTPALSLAGTVGTAATRETRLPAREAGNWVGSPASGTS